MTFPDEKPEREFRPASEDISILGNFSREEWQLITSCARNIEFHKNETLLKEGEIDDAVYILLSGEVEVIAKRTFGRQKKIASIEQGSVFGEVAFFDNRPRSASIHAATEGKVLRISRANFDKISAANPGLAQRMLLDLGKVLAHRFRSGFPYKV